MLYDNRKINDLGKASRPRTKGSFVAAKDKVRREASIACL